MESLYYFFFILFFQIHSEIINNPHLIDNGKYNFLLHTSPDGYNYIISSGKSFKLEKETVKIENKITKEYDEHSFLIYDKSYHNYLYNKPSKKFYEIEFNPFIGFKEGILDLKTIDNNDCSMEIMGSIAQENDFIIYGIYEKSIFFSSYSIKYCYSKEIEEIFTELSCKLIEGEKFICVMLFGKDINVAILDYHIDSKNSHNGYLELDSSQTMELPIYYYLALYDTSIKDLKFLCGGDTYYAYCFFIKTLSKENEKIYFTDNILTFNIGLISENVCRLTEFNDEYLFCCGFEDYIKCFRLNKINDDFGLIKEFNINLEGGISHLNIQSNDAYVIFYYYAFNGQDNIYQYYLYYPKCYNLEFSILKHINEAKSAEEQLRIENLLEIRTNNNYFIKFENPFNIFGKLHKEGVPLDIEPIQISIEESEKILDFIIDDLNEINGGEITIDYTVTLEEVYSNKCHINIKFLKTCYHSCGKCYKDINASDINEHNCITCNQNFYRSPLKERNCYQINEKEENWYFDERISEFGICNSTCKTCSGPTEHDCLTCKSGFCIYNNYCRDNCPQETLYATDKKDFTDLLSTDKIKLEETTYKEKPEEKEDYTETEKTVKTEIIKDSIEIEDNSKNVEITGIEISIFSKDSKRAKGTLEIKFSSGIENSQDMEYTTYTKDSLEIKYSSEVGKETTYMENNKETKDSIESEGSKEIEEKRTTENINNKYNCSIACLTCYKEASNNSTNCLECNIYSGYFPLYDSNSICIKNDTNEIVGYYLDKKIYPYSWKKCHKNCETCQTQGNDNNMNCLSCKANLLYEISKGNCLLSCPNGYEKDELKNECIFKIFDQTTTVNEFKNQIINNISLFVNSSKVINGSDFIAVVLSSDNMDPKQQLKNGISAIDLGNCTEVLKEHYNLSKEDNLIIVNMESKNNKSNTSSDNSFNLGKNIQLDVFDYSGRKLNLSVCKEDIKVMKYIGDVTELDIKSAMSLANDGIDVFNPEDDFFNDICHPFESSDGRDIILTDRRNDIYQNASFCQDGCTYSGINYDLMAANCICDSNYLQIEENNETIINEKNKKENVNFKSITKSFIANLLDFNFEVIYCYNLVLNTNILIKNIGFYSLTSLLFLQIIFLFVYLVKKLKPLKNYMLIYNNNNNLNNNAINNNNINNKEIIEGNPPKKNNNSIFTSLDDIEENKAKKIIKKKIKKIIKKRIKKDYKNKKRNEDDKNLNIPRNESQDIKQSNLLNFPLDNKDSDGKLIIPQNIIPIFNLQTPIFTNINKKNNTIPKSNKKMKLNNISEREEINTKNQNKDLISENKENPDIKHAMKYQKEFEGKNIKLKKQNILSNNINIIETISERKEEINKLEINLSQTDSDLQDMDYEEAIIYDKRSYIRMYWSFLVDSQIILGTFCTDNHLNLFIIKLSFFICTFQISFFLNALFYTDEYISDAYHNEGVLDFFSGLPKAIYSFFATLITTNLLKMLSNSQSELMKVIKEKGKISDYIRIIDIKISKLRKKLVIYFILVFSLGFIFLYYVTSFCAVYRHSQKFWFYGCLESFGLDSLSALIICTILSIFRYISIKKHIKYFYTLANIISTFL